MTDTRTLPAPPSPTGTWVQTDRATHEAWARMSVKSPRASALLHILVARIGQHNAVVASQSVLAKLMGCNRRTIVRAIQDLVEGRWIEVRQIGDRGTVNAYVINDRVAWHGPRESLRYSLFSATVILAEDEQPDRSELGQQEPLRKLPRLFPGEQQLPAGDGLPPPSQPFFDGMEPALPALDEPEPDPAMQDELSQLVTGLGNKLRAPDASPPDDATDM